MLCHIARAGQLEASLCVDWCEAYVDNWTGMAGNNAQDQLRAWLSAQ